MSYTKLANSILTSTLWQEDDQTRIVWMTLLAMSDRNGEVQASIPGLAHIARVSLEKTREAIHRFLSPDLDSRTKDDEGRRLEEIPGGWLLINHKAYRDLASDDDRRAKAAERQKRFREKLRRNASVTHESRQIPQAEAEAEADAKAEADADSFANAKEKKNFRDGSKFDSLISSYAAINAELIGTAYVTTGHDRKAVSAFIGERAVDVGEFARVARESIEQGMKRKFAPDQRKSFTLRGLCENWSSIFAAIQTPDGTSQEVGDLNRQSAL